MSYVMGATNWPEFVQLPLSGWKTSCACVDLYFIIGQYNLNIPVLLISSGDTLLFHEIYIAGFPHKYLWLRPIIYTFSTWDPFSYW